MVNSNTTYVKEKGEDEVIPGVPQLVYMFTDSIGKDGKT